jgi:hypothetical protein
MKPRAREGGDSFSLHRMNYRYDEYALLTFRKSSRKKF